MPLSSIDFSAFFNQQTVAFLSSYQGVLALLAVIVAGVAFKMILAVGAGAGSSEKAGSQMQKESDNRMEEKEQEEEKQAQQDKALEQEKINQQELEKQRQEQQEKIKQQEKEKLDDLFKLENKRTEDKSKEEEEKKKEQEKEEREKEEKLGEKRRDLSHLKSCYTEMFQNILVYIEKGQTLSDITNDFLSRLPGQIPPIEAYSLAESLGHFFKEKQSAQKQTAILGLDPSFEQKSALSALKRGEYDVAIEFLSRQAQDLESVLTSTRREDVRTPALEKASCLYRSIGVLARVVDSELSFESLQKAQKYAPEEPFNSALIARAYYESGKTKKSEMLFEDILEKATTQDYATQYAIEMIPQIKTERVINHSMRIRQSYEKRIEDEAPLNQKEASNTQQMPQKNKRLNAFVLDELQDRQSERFVS